MRTTHLALAACSFLVGAGQRNGHAQSSPRSTIAVTLSEWSLTPSASRTPLGPTSFVIRNAGKIPHAFEIEGHGIEKRTRLLQPGEADSLTIVLRAGRYELYCPVGGDSHRHLGMSATLAVVSGGSTSPEGAPHTPVSAATHSESRPTRALLTGGGTTVQILPGPFPFADSAAKVISARPADQMADLHHKAEQGPYSNNVATIAGSVHIEAWDRGAVSDSVNGVADFTTQDGARWRLLLDRVQTADIPFNPRFGGVIFGLYYHGSSGVHTPLVPTIKSAVALWSVGHLYRNDVLVTDSAMVHVMLLSRTRRASDWSLQCWDCSRQPVEELQLQITAAPGSKPFEAPGGFLFVNWERSTVKLSVH